jgi:hypothetical protein
LELVVYSLDFDRGNGGTLDRTQENPTQRIPDGMAVSGLERFSDEFSVGRRGAFLDLGELGGEFELSETFWHGGELCRLRS